MTREEFELELIPLTENELNYRSNPNFFPELFQKLQPLSKVYDEKKNNIKNMLFLSPCSIFPGKTDIRNFTSPHICFNRQDRFSNIPPHSHGYIEINYLYSGSCKAVVNGENLQMVQGDVCIMDRNVRHTILPVGEADIVLNVMLSTEFFSNAFLKSLAGGGPVSRFLAGVLAEQNKHTHYLVFHTRQNRKVKELIVDMIIEYLYPGICCENVLRFSLNLLFIEFSRCFRNQLEEQQQMKQKIFLTEILQYIETHCTECTLKGVASRFMFHPNYLSRLIRKETGSTFQEIVGECRMNRVEFLLQHSGMPIGQIADECGYENHSFFRQKFMERYGMLPGKYREMAGGSKI